MAVADAVVATRDGFGSLVVILDVLGVLTAAGTGVVARAGVVIGSGAFAGAVVRLAGAGMVWVILALFVFVDFINVSMELTFLSTWNPGQPLVWAATTGVNSFAENTTGFIADCPAAKVTRIRRSWPGLHREPTEFISLQALVQLRQCFFLLSPAEKSIAEAERVLA